MDRYEVNIHCNKWQSTEEKIIDKRNSIQASIEKKFRQNRDSYQEKMI